MSLFWPLKLLTTAHFGSPMAFAEWRIWAIMTDLNLRPAGWSMRRAPQSSKIPGPAVMVSGTLWRSLFASLRMQKSPTEVE
ncbi:hypothetical protein SLA2020_390730 [Shorea laevis]